MCLQTLLRSVIPLKLLHDVYISIYSVLAAEQTSGVPQVVAQASFAAMLIISLLLAMYLAMVSLSLISFAITIALCIYPLQYLTCI